MSFLELVLLMLGSSTAAAFLIAILICTVGGAAIYLREFVMTIYRQFPRVQRLN